jgi:hypothetical protein
MIRIICFEEGICRRNRSFAKILSPGRNLAMLLFMGLCLIVHGLGAECLNAQTRRHIVAYGGIPDKYVETIARKADILIVSKITDKQIREMKRINQQLLVLKYHSAVGIYPTNPEWDTIRVHEDWFVHVGNSKLINNKYGWYLMNIANKQWRSYVSGLMNRQTSESFDGIFIDDCWDRFIDKFSNPGVTRSITGGEVGLMEWREHMLALLKEVRKTFPKKIIINGAFSEYLRVVDGCMEESFIHSNTQSDSFLPNSSAVLRQLKKVQILQKYGKMLLLQSGTSGDGTGNPSRIFSLCLGSYLLIEDKNTSFNFQPRKGYYFKGLEPYDIDYQLASPKGDFYFQDNGIHEEDLLRNGDFSLGLLGWRLRNGNPSLDVCAEGNDRCILFQGTGKSGDMIESEYIKVEANKEYRISLKCKSERNDPGSLLYKKLGVLGRFYDRNMNYIPEVCDLMVDRGRYDWMPFERVCTSPGSAAYFKLSVGFIGDGSGKCWVDDVCFGRVMKKGYLMRRDFSNGVVIVNSGTAESRIEVPRGTMKYEDYILKIEPGEGRIIVFQDQ